MGTDMRRSPGLGRRASSIAFRDATLILEARAPCRDLAARWVSARGVVPMLGVAE